MKNELNHKKVIALVVEANQSKDIHKAIERFKRMVYTSGSFKREYREALLQLGVAPDSI